MEDAEVVAAIVTGDPAGLSAALDRYGPALFSYCRATLADEASPAAAEATDATEAAGAVLDTFIIATSKLDGLADPARLGPWLHAVARNQCHRRLLAAGLTPHEPAGFTAEPVMVAQQPFPEDLRGRVMTVCADNTPAGRAHRVSVTHRAGAFGHDGFPRPVIPPGQPAWWRRAVVRAAAAATAVAAIAAVGIVLAFSGSGAGQGSAAGAGGGEAAAGLGTPGAGATATSRVSHPRLGRRAAAGVVTSPGSSSSATVAQPSPSRLASPPASPSRSASASPSPSASPSAAQGTLAASTTRLSLVSVGGKAGFAAFSITAVGGPVGYFEISSGRTISVTPRSGSLVAGSRITIEVSAASRVSFSAALVLYPGGATVTVQVTAKAAPASAV